MFTFNTVLQIMVLLAGAALFVFSGPAKSNDYTDAKIADAKKDIKENVDLKILAIKETIESIKQTSSRVESAQDQMKKDINEIAKAVGAKR